MEFGAGRFEEADDRYQLLTESPKNTGPRAIYVGLPQWGVREWKDSLYPSNLAAKDYLSYYSQVLSCVELSSTFYTKLGDDKILNWCQQVGPGFKFLPKWPKLITHQSCLQGQQGEIKDFLRQLELFDDKLGTSIVQLPPNFSRDFHRELYYFLVQIPKGFPLTLELRHSSWFESGKLYSKLENYLEQNGFSMTMTDAPGRPDLFHTSFPGRFNVVRFLSDENSSNDQQRLEAWKKYLATYQGSLGICLHRPDNIGTPEMLEYLDPEAWGKITELRNKSKAINLDLFD